MKKNSGIYCIINRVNQKIYIGSAKNLKDREKQHFSLLKNNKHVNKYLQNSYNKHGYENFEFKI
ncbi:MAG: GIY-YIG nuclease family protein, partial [Candidatus Eremiobacterota bacterium]